jgi:midasin
VSLSSQLAHISGLAVRWRRLELASWRGLLNRTAARISEGAHAGWFHLYRVLSDGTVGPAELATVVEQFVQGSPLGEFAERLKLLQSFEAQLASMSAEPGSNVGKLAAVLHNIRGYYSQFAPGVRAAISSGLTELEKQLKDFVALAKWEDRGYYALKVSNEKAQRQLHRLTRRTAEVLRHPLTANLAAAAGVMGFGDLALPGLETPEPHFPLQPQAMPTLELLEALNDASSAIEALTKGLAAEALDQAVAPLDSSSRTAQLPQLTKRFPEVLSSSLAPQRHDSAAAVQNLASSAASRALELRADVTKGSKARKKKGLIDLFKALSEAGISKHRSAVPADQRSVTSWFLLVR